MKYAQYISELIHADSESLAFNAADDRKHGKFVVVLTAVNQDAAEADAYSFKELTSASMWWDQSVASLLVEEILKVKV